MRRDLGVVVPVDAETLIGVGAVVHLEMWSGLRCVSESALGEVLRRCHAQAVVVVERGRFDDCVDGTQQFFGVVIGRESPPSIKRLRLNFNAVPVVAGIDLALNIVHGPSYGERSVLDLGR